MKDAYIKHKLFPLALIILITGSCTKKSTTEVELTEKLFEELFELVDTIHLPEEIRGVINYFDTHENGNLILSDASTQIAWVYVKEKDEWKELIIDNCHPGIINTPIGLGFSDDSILLSNSANWTGYRFNLDGSCGNIFVESFIPPNFIKGISDGFLGISNDFATKRPYLTRFDQSGNEIYKSAYTLDPNPIFSNNIIGGGIAVLNDSIALVTSASTPEIHTFNYKKGEFLSVEPPLVPEIFKGVNDRFDAKKFEESLFIYLYSLGPHMILGTFDLLNDETAFFYISYMLTEDDDILLIQNLRNGNSFHVSFPKNDDGIFISNRKLYRFSYMDEGTQISVYEYKMRDSD